MKKPMDYVYRFCNKHPNFGIPNLMKYIVGGNVVFWLLSLVNPVLMSYLSFSPAAILHGQVWRLISFIFTPSALISSPCSLSISIISSAIRWSATGVRRSSRYFSSPASFSPRYSPSSSTLSPA